MRDRAMKRHRDDDDFDSDIPMKAKRSKATFAFPEDLEIVKLQEESKEREAFENKRLALEERRIELLEKQLAVAAEAQKNQSLMINALMEMMQKNSK